MSKITVKVGSNLDEFQEKLDNLRKALDEFNAFELEVWQVDDEWNNNITLDAKEISVAIEQRNFEQEAINRSLNGR